MFGSVFKFEIRYHLTRPITWFYFTIFFALAFFFMASDAVTMGGGVGQVKRNAPWVVAQTMMILVAVGQVILTGLVGTAVLRDYQFKTHELLFTTPITRFAYLGGRFGGALVVMILVHLGIPFGLMAGSVMPWVDHAKFAPVDIGMHLLQFSLLVIPTVVLLSAIFFTVGALTRSLFAIYTQGIMLLVAWSISSRMLSDLSNQKIAALADPFGLQAFSLLTRYWTVAEKNGLTVPMEGVMLENRLIWIGIAIALVVITFAAFRFRSAPITLGRKKAEVVEPPAPVIPIVQPAQRFDGAAWRQQVASTTRLSFFSIVRQIPFLAIVTIGVINMFMSAATIDQLYGEKTWPVTYTMAEVLEGSFLLFFIILITIYAGEAVWRERQLQLDQITDSLPTRSSVSLLGKFFGLVSVEAFLLLIMIAAGVIVQTAKGYHNYEIGLYFKYLFGTTFPPMVQLTALAFLIHVLVNHKYAGHVLMILFWIARVSLSAIGVEHQLVNFGSMPPFTYSDMNGFGPFVGNIALSVVYWSGVSLVFLVIAYLYWVRGTESKWKSRNRWARLRWGGRPAAVTAVGASLALAGGGTIFYNTNVLNNYQTSKERRAEQARYEKTYKQYEKLALPRLVAADVRADLEPERAAFWASGTFTFVNKHARPLDSLWVTIAHQELRIDTLAWDRPTETLVSDSALGTRIYRLASPLAPGDTIHLRYRARWEPRGFPNGGARTLVAENGAFVNSEYFPLLGYQDQGELMDDDERRKQKLPPKARMPSIDDESARASSYLTSYADWIDFKATVTTAPDQIAIAPGYLVKEYQENGRRVFEYAMDRPMANFYSFLSGRYAVKKDEHNGIKLEIYYHPGHEYNLDRMMASMKASLDYFGTHFSPYQFRQVRILEFPRYAGFAQAFPNTVPYSESIGFILRTTDGDDDLDMPFYVTAHEVGHQWWGHQVVGANMQGATWFSEGLANYSALTVMEKKYGRDRLQKFLANELDRYLQGRTTERKRELPLLLVENQGYIHYNKGSLALYAFRDLIGEEAMNRALSRFTADKAFSLAPYPTSREFVQYLEAETPDSLRYVIDDLFKTITLWDDQTTEATAVKQPDGKYQVSIKVQARKFRADSLGDQSEIPIGDLVDIGVFGDREPGNKLGKPLYLQKVWVRSRDTTFTVTVDGEPRRAGIDPYNKLIDRDPKDNVKDVTR